ncbi:hypothetical protein DPMN_062197, partial [Dreissena polymorpha]
NTQVDRKTDDQTDTQADRQTDRPRQCLVPNSNKLCNRDPDIISDHLNKIFGLILENNNNTFTGEDIESASCNLFDFLEI